MALNELTLRERELVSDELKRPEYRGIRQYINDGLELILDQCANAEVSIVGARMERGVKVARMVIAWSNPNKIRPGYMVSAELPLEQLERMVVGAAANAVAFSPAMGAAKIFAQPTLAVQLRVGSHDVMSGLGFEPIRAAEPVQAVGPA
jgi:hypothetical protein